MCRPAVTVQAVFPRGRPVPGRPPTQGVCALPAAQRTAAEPALPLLATEPRQLWQEQGPQHLPPHHPMPVLHGEPLEEEEPLWRRRSLSGGVSLEESLWRIQHTKLCVLSSSGIDLLPPRGLGWRIQAYCYPLVV